MSTNTSSRKPRAAATAKAEPTETPTETTTPTADPELTAEEYMKHREEVLARLPDEKDRPKNIYARLAQLNGQIGMIRKTGVNAFHKYTYAKEADLVEEIRPMLSEYGIWLEQRLLGDPARGFVAHQRLAQYKSGADITVESLTAITKEFRFVWWNPESGELETTEWEPFMGYGDDNGDKGYYKAETGAVKYFLMKTFMVATGNDPEADQRVDERAARRDAGGGARVERAGGRPAQPGGRQQNTSAPQSRQIGELLRANGIKTSAEAIELLESIIGDKIEVPIVDGEPDLLGGLTAAISGLTGEKAGKVVGTLRARVGKAEAFEAAKPKELKPEGGWKKAEVVDEEPDGKSPSEAGADSGDSTEAKAEDGDDGTIAPDIA